MASISLIAFIWFQKNDCSDQRALAKNSLSSNIKGMHLFKKWIAPLVALYYRSPTIKADGWFAESDMTLHA